MSLATLYWVSVMWFIVILVDLIIVGAVLERKLNRIEKLLRNRVKEPSR